MALFKVEDMSCGHCVATIEAAVKALDPAAAVACDLQAKTVRVESRAAPLAIAAALADAGYPAQTLS